MRPTVVILSAFLSPFRSGAEACAEEVPRALAGRYRFTVVTARLRRDLPRSDTLPGGIPVVRVGLGFPIDKWLFPFLAPLAARKLQPDILHAVLESYAGLALVFARMTCPSARRILTCQSTNTSLALRLMHRSATSVTVISRVLFERAKRLGRPDAVLIPNGVPFARIRSACEATAKIPGRALFVGRLEPVKGVDVLLRAFAALVSSPDLAHVQLRIVGDGSERANLERLAAELGITQRVSFAGRVAPEEIQREYAAAQVFAGLSRSEALGNVFLEAQAAGCAVVATRTGGIPDIVTDGVTGILIPPDDVEAASHALRTLLTHADLRERLARAGVENAARYDWTEVAGRYAEVYGGSDQ